MSYLSWEHFDRLFREFKRYAYRLETLPQYIVQPEKEAFASYLRGDLHPPSSTYADWQEMIRKTVESGRSISRVHLWPEKLTPYLRFELEWGYLYNAEAGDDIRLLLPSAPIEVRTAANEDYWLFDDEIVVIVDYEKDGAVIGARKMTDRSKTPIYIELMKLCLEHATPLRDYLHMVRSGEIHQ